jgi:LmbE family N-acetylglucosaminyl deacetylase
MMSATDGQITGSGQWLACVERFAEGLAMGRAMPLPEVSMTTDTMAPLVAADVLICSPHPDDEALNGTMALRLQLEDQARVMNLAMTLGSDPRRQAARQAELAASCRVLGFKVGLAREPAGFRLGGPSAPAPGSVGWQLMEDELVELLVVVSPRLVCLPHDDDGHATHVAVHYLARQAIARYVRREERAVLLIQSEFWHPMRSPNLLVGIEPAEVATLVNALSHHVGEMARQPLHLLLPPRLMDNVRRGSALLGGYGGKAALFTFGELYHLSLVSPAGIRQPVGPTILPPGTRLSLTGLFDLVASA